MLTLGIFLDDNKKKTQMKITSHEICLSPCKINDYKVCYVGDVSGLGCGNGWVFSQVDVCTYRMSELGLDELSH